MANSGPPPEWDLNSWKEIAGFLKVTERTAQRWEETRGLPVRRSSGPRGRVAARSTDLASWRQAQLQQPPWWRTHRKVLIACAGVCALMALSLLVGWRLAVGGRPELWRQAFEPLIAPAPTPRGAHFAVTVGGMIYAGQGGSNHPQSRGNGYFDRYDPTTNAWTRLSMPTDAYGRAGVVVDDRIYAFGGVEHAAPLRRVDVYHPERDRWSPRAPMPTPRSNAAAAVANDIICVMGGSPVFGDNPGTTANEAYDPVQDAWRGRTPMPRPRYWHSVAATHGRIYVFGGRPGPDLDLIDVYDPETDAWTTLPDRMPRPRSHAGTAVLNGKVLLIGGIDSRGRILASVDEYDPATGRWREVAPMPTPRMELAATEVNGVVYAIAGTNQRGYVSVVEAFDPTGAPLASTRGLRGPWSKTVPPTVLIAAKGRRLLPLAGATPRPRP